MDRKRERGSFINIAVLADVSIEENKKEKIEKYQDLKRKIGREIVRSYEDIDKSVIELKKR